MLFELFLSRVFQLFFCLGFTTFNAIEERRKTNKKMLQTNSLRVHAIQDCIIVRPTWKSGIRSLRALTNEKAMGQLEAEAEEAVTGAGHGRVYKITKQVCNEFRENIRGGGGVS